MKNEIGLIVVVVAMLFFYLRLIILQRQRAKQQRLEKQQPMEKQQRLNKRQRIEKRRAEASTAKKKAPSQPAGAYSLLSQDRRDWLIAGVGLVLMVAGVLLNAGWISWTAVQPYWWAPTALGIVAFSWAFRL